MKAKARSDVRSSTWMATLSGSSSPTAKATEQRKAGFKQPATLRAAVFIGGAILDTRSSTLVIYIAEKLSNFRFMAHMRFVKRSTPAIEILKIVNAHFHVFRRISLTTRESL